MKQIFIQRLNEKMKEQGLTKKDLAEKTGLSARAIEYFQNGKRFPNVESLLKISKAFNVSMEYMIGEEDEPSLINSDLSFDTDRMISIIKRSMEYLKQCRGNGVDK